MYQTFVTACPLRNYCQLRAKLFESEEYYIVEHRYLQLKVLNILVVYQSFVASVTKTKILEHVTPITFTTNNDKQLQLQLDTRFTMQIWCLQHTNAIGVLKCAGATK